MIRFGIEILHTTDKGKERTSNNTLVHIRNRLLGLHTVREGCMWRMRPWKWRAALLADRKTSSSFWL